MDPPDVGALSLNDSFDRTPPRPASPGLPTTSSTPVPTPAAATTSTLGLDMTLSSAVAALVHHLVQPLAAHYPHEAVMDLRKRLNTQLTAAYQPNWNESNPQQGSGTRSLIADRVHGLPPLLRRAAGDLDPAVWARAIATSRRKKHLSTSAASDEPCEEWEVWCDPGMVVWRWGGWGWDDAEFDPIKRTRESYHVIWQAAPAAPSQEAAGPSVTPVRTSKAIPIRAPGLNMASNTSSPAPSTRASTPLLPAYDISSPLARRTHPRAEPELDRRGHTRSDSRQSFRNHKGQGSTSSNSSDSSDTNSGHTQLLTPASRPGSADLFPEDKVHGGDNADTEPATPPAAAEDGEARRGRDPSPSTPRTGSPSNSTPTVTPYDGGNVTVLGGGTKLGGSRPSSVHGSRGDRTRSPSVSIASRALSNAVGPNSNGVPGSPRKVRTRRRIIPTHIGYFGQPGVGAPVMGAFGMQAAMSKPYQQWPHGGQPGGVVSPGGVGVGVAPPPVGGMPGQMGMKRTA